MLFVIAYSCFTSAYYISFEFPDNDVLMIFEHVVFASYSIDILFNFMRLPPNQEGNINAESERSHLAILKRYLKSGWFFLDIAATFPFYLFSNVSGGGGLKLLRMVRIPKILNLVDENRFDRIVEILVRSLPRDKRIEYRIVIKQLFKVLRLMLLTVIITYFLGCGFYLIA